jgi:hypothetical protein
MVQKVGNFCLTNDGAFVVKLQFVYWDRHGNKMHVDGTAGYPPAQTVCLRPGKAGVPDGSMVSLYAFAVWANDSTASQIFTYEASSNVTANYTISGTGLNNELVLGSVQ